MQTQLNVFVRACMREQALMQISPENGMQKHGISISGLMASLIAGKRNQDMVLPTRSNGYFIACQLNTKICHVENVPQQQSISLMHCLEMAKTTTCCAVFYYNA